MEDKIRCYLKRKEWDGKVNYGGKVTINGHEYWVNLYPPEGEKTDFALYLKPVVKKG